MNPSLKRIISDFLYAHSEFTCKEYGDGGAILSGEYTLDASYEGIRLAEVFELQVTVSSDYPKSLPVVRELSRIIIPNYEHLYIDRSFCLGIQGELLLIQQKDPSLISFLDGPVRSYLYSYLFYDRYGRYPFGDRPHGAAGILQFYGELFGTADIAKTFALLKAICKDKYLGRQFCPCGSGLIGKKCHQRIILRLKNSDAIEAIRNDFSLITQERQTKLEGLEKGSQLLFPVG